MPLTDLACPKCLSEKNTENPLMTVPGKYGYFCKENHEFRDTEQLMAMNPKKLSIPNAKPPKKPADGTSEMRLILGSGLIDALRARFGDRLDNSVASILRVMLDPDAFVVVSNDAKRLEQIFGEKVPHADSLVGKVFALKADRDEWKVKAEEKKAANEQSSGSANNDVPGDFVQMTIRVTTDQFSFLFEKAKFNNVPPTKYLQNCIATAIENQWF